MYVCVHMWRLEDGLPESALSFHQCGPRERCWAADLYLLAILSFPTSSPGWVMGPGASRGSCRRIPRSASRQAAPEGTWGDSGVPQPQFCCFGHPLPSASCLVSTSALVFLLCKSGPSSTWLTSFASQTRWSGLISSRHRHPEQPAP